MKCIKSSTPYLIALLLLLVISLIEVPSRSRSSETRANDVFADQRQGALEQVDLISMLNNNSND